jgi:hypothetical protein
MAALLLGGSVGCSWSGAVQRRAALDLQCPEPQIVVVTISKFWATYSAQGCGRQAQYIVRDGQAIMNPPVAQPATTPPGAAAVEPPPPPPPPPSPPAPNPTTSGGIR